MSVATIDETTASADRPATGRARAGGQGTHTDVSPVVCAGVHKSFPTGWFGQTPGKPVLDGVTLALPPGAVVGLLGTNGAGKSTLLRLLVGLLTPTEGAVTVLGEPAHKLSPEAKERLGYVPQEVRLPPWLTVHQTTKYFAAFYESWDHAWCEALLDRWELPRNDRVGPLSTGQLQKLGLVLAMAHRPELLILDEPVAALDPIARRDFLATLVELGEESMDRGRPQTVVFSTHLTGDLERAASHVALLRAGRVELFEEMDALKEGIVRVRAVSSGRLPADTPDALHVDAGPNTVAATVRSADVSAWQAWGESRAAEVTVEGLTLEDLFLELHGR